MENYQMSRPGCRPYNRTCGMARPLPAEKCERMARPVPAEKCERMARPVPADRCERMTRPARSSRGEECSCRMPGTESRDMEMYTHLQDLEPAMAYVPCQEFSTTFDLNYALRVGTIFPEMCRPFCGKRGNRR